MSTNADFQPNILKKSLFSEKKQYFWGVKLYVKNENTEISTFYTHSRTATDG